MRIGELSRQLGISERMLRYYEQEGLLAPARTESGYRDYDADTALVAKRIGMLRAAGLKLESIRELLPCILDDQPVFDPCLEVRETLYKEAANLDRKLRDLQECRDIISGYLKSLDQRPPVA
ncbi:MerR family transcriptional regulator [Halomonas caseinilytica]|uniref:DNA-binding transcriptional regulator, MerR family n=1 Tax=Halomonas caseinilytica TaxID=438744 RepID=A0A1M6NVS0_9GAMM|nr:MerR family transcriptional regulator [Halomonas caseinilytica]SEM26011.1 DNA-binding transcriptional regulator, MerR family [Halomonas caseinilytica]SHJ99839.1 DNA-binding transcriptional regulator, MerR family [Halomonas caseinilytica]